MRLFPLHTNAALIALGLVLSSASLALLTAPPADPPQTSPAERQPYLGTWQREVADATGRTRITLDIRADGSYNKVLDATLKGQSFHGDEQGSWAANGPLVLLSGDQKSAPSRHDLRNYQKLR